MAFENLPDIIRLQGIQRVLESSPEPFEELTRKRLTTGHFADAYKRTGLTNPHAPVLVAGLDTTQMRTNVKEGASSGNVGQDAQLKEIMGVASPIWPVPVGVQPDRTIQHTDPLFNKEEIRRRLGPARKKAAPIDPMEGMDADLRKAMEEEDKRLRRK